jgi:nitroimidazol reductase NimA-like FMN-containing flavoprotein (pyridoxamine 5'-phosphate oxidase superfamily)
MAAKSRTRVTRMPSRANYERETIEAILDEAIVSHLGTVSPDGHPVVIPTLHARAGDWLYIHGSAASPTLRRAERAEICLTATLLDGLVLARSAVHHSVNYRSVVVFGQAEKIEDTEGKSEALKAFTEKLVPGRWGDARLPTEKELRAVGVLRLPLEEASAKVRTGGPLDDEDDYALPVWAGTIDLRLVAEAPKPDERLLPDVKCPSYVSELSRART